MAPGLTLIAVLEDRIVQLPLQPERSARSRCWPCVAGAWIGLAFLAQGLLSRRKGRTS